MRLTAKTIHLAQADAYESTTWKGGLGKVEIRATVAKIQLFLNEKTFCDTSKNSRDTILHKVKDQDHYKSGTIPQKYLLQGQVVKLKKRTMLSCGRADPGL